MKSTVFLQRIADLYDEFKQHDARQSDRLRRTEILKQNLLSYLGC